MLPVFGHRPLSRRSLTTSKESDPLRILFCGSDDFSIASLKALHREHENNPHLVKSIDVVCKPGKPVGRGLKTIREVPIANVARELSLPLHQIDTFTKWQPPTILGEPINLIIAVSFGLFVPPRILDGAKYGGLNVHPSMLPDFRGSAPLHHTLLSGCTRTGISLQTLHPKYFDQGTVLAQTPQPGIEIPLQNEITVSELTDLLAPKGAEMLVQGLRDRLHVPPLRTVQQQQIDEITALTRPAPKIGPEDKHIDWKTWTSETILTRARLLGPLWNMATTEIPPLEQKRIIWSSGFRRGLGPLDFNGSIPPGIPMTSTTLTHSILGTDNPASSKIRKHCLYVGTVDGEILMADVAKVEGGQAGAAATSASKARLFPDSIHPRSWEHWNPLM